MATRVRRLKPTPAEVLGFLIKSHYLSEDLPGVITTDRFAEFCVSQFDGLESIEALLGRVNYCGTFSAPRTTTARRVPSTPILNSTPRPRSLFRQRRLPSEFQHGSGHSR